MWKLRETLGSVSLHFTNYRASSHTGHEPKCAWSLLSRTSKQKMFAPSPEFRRPFNKFMPTLFFMGNTGTSSYLCLHHGIPSMQQCSHLLSGFTSMCWYKWVGLTGPISRLPMASVRICSNKISGDYISCSGRRYFQRKRPCSFTYVSWVPKKKMGYLFAGGFTAPSGSSSICESEMEKGLFPNVVSLIQESLTSHGSASAGTSHPCVRGWEREDGWWFFRQAGHTKSAYDRNTTGRWQKTKEQTKSFNDFMGIIIHKGNKIKSV